MIFEVLVVVIIQIAFFRDVIVYSLVDGCLCFGETCCPHLEKLGSLKILVPMCQTTWHLIPVDMDYGMLIEARLSLGDSSSFPCAENHLL